MANVLLGVTGSVAALKTPIFHGRLKGLGHAVKVVATQASLYFFDPAAIDPLDPARPQRNPAAVVLDEDEWPGRDGGRRYERDDDVLHIELRRWADLLLIAPLDANTLGKLAAGLADNFSPASGGRGTPNRPVVLAPAMNTLMWRHPLTALCLRQIALDARRPAGLAGAARGRPRRLDQRPLPPAAGGRPGEPPPGLRRRGRRRPGRPGRRRRSRSVPSR